MFVTVVWVWLLLSGKVSISVKGLYIQMCVHVSTLKEIMWDLPQLQSINYHLIGELVWLVMAIVGNKSEHNRHAFIRLSFAI